ncbi:MAG: lipoyl(octanoyl) transferase LipB [Ardenticatenaceae bacterium]|nr:lipoyl(octanoyl) transferase LipB [Ardenticatenaceae bacterium]MCB9446221.1 lipoyl(octanoyl) transferase LipB [Ardenticatenaceae bacterium]
MIEVEWAGQVAYDAAWEWQKLLVAERTESPDLADKLLLLEHPHTYTLGRRGKIENLLWDEATLTEKGVSVHRVDRGGDITYHGPGQLVGYPIFNLAHLGRYGLSRIKAYVRDIEEVLIQALVPFGIEGQRFNGFTGVWVDTPDGLEKIAAIGVYINNRGITSHGFALNVATDLSYFSGIIPCGITDHGVTSMEKVLRYSIPTTDLIPHITTAFEQVFNVKLEDRARARG